LQQIKGKLAIANAKVAYQKHREILNSDRWQALAEKGPVTIRLLETICIILYTISMSMEKSIVKI
jgi:hypothetical protein